MASAARKPRTSVSPCKLLVLLTNSKNYRMMYLFCSDGRPISFLTQQHRDLWHNNKEHDRRVARKKMEPSMNEGKLNLPKKRIEKSSYQLTRGYIYQTSATDWKEIGRACPF